MCFGVKGTDRGKIWAGGARDDGVPAQHEVGTARVVRIHKTKAADRSCLKIPIVRTATAHGIGFKPSYAIAMRLSIDNTAVIRANLERAEVTRVGETMAAECGLMLTSG